MISSTPDGMIELTFLGTGGAVGTAERDNTALALSFGRDPVVLLDCPGAVIPKLRRAGLDPMRVSAILVTHVHPDHIYGLPSLIHGLFLEEGRIRLYGSKETVELCAGLLDLFKLRAERIRMRVEFVPLEAGQAFDLPGPVRVETFPVKHSSASLGYCLGLDGGRRLVFPGDTPPDPAVVERARGADFLVHDCSAPERFFVRYPVLRTMHTSARELGLLAREAGVDCLLPCHFFGEVDYPMSEVEGEIRESFPGRLIMPSDLTRVGLAP
jgi:ribonuclease Z